MEIEYNGKKWNIRNVTIRDKHFSVASEELEDELLTDSSSYKDDDAKAIDEMICYFVPPQFMTAPEPVLNSYLLQTH